MANECIEYKLHRNAEGRMTAPTWMSDGGYYMDNSTKTLIGFVPVEGERDWYVPDTVSMLTEQEFVTRCMAMHSASPFMKMNDEDPSVEPEAMTDAEAETMMREFYQAKVAE